MLFNFVVLFGVGPHAGREKRSFRDAADATRFADKTPGAQIYACFNGGAEGADFIDSRGRLWKECN